MINDNIFNTHGRGATILISPLNWGLGHATRCIPIINELFTQRCRVIIAADERLNFLLKKEFPGAVFLSLKGYNITYSRNGYWLIFKLFLQFPKIIFSVWRENLWLKKIIKRYGIHAVISDNRFGLYNKKIPSVYITHQLHIKTGNRFSEKISQKMHYFFIKKYKYCWIPDCKKNSLAGELSHPANVPSNVTYIGPLSRFEKVDNLTIRYYLLVSLSGPEPQRSIFEKIILDQLKNFEKKVLIVRGLPAETKEKKCDNKLIEMVNHLSAPELNRAFLQSEMIISRSGYSTIMDLVKLGRKAILVPTPGQSEQEYLARYHQNKGYFYSMPQKNFSLNEAIAVASTFPFKCLPSSNNEYKKTIGEFVKLIKP